MKFLGYHTSGATTSPSSCQPPPDSTPQMHFPWTLSTIALALLITRIECKEHVVPRSYDPSSPSFNHISAGIAFAERGMPKESQAAFDAAIRWAPTDGAAGAFMNMGVFQMRQGMYLQSARYLMAAQALVDKYGEDGATQGDVVGLNKQDVVRLAKQRTPKLMPKLQQIMSGVDQEGPIKSRSSELLSDETVALLTMNSKITDMSDALYAGREQAKAAKAASAARLLAKVYDCEPERSWWSTTRGGAGPPPPKRVRVPGGREELIRMLGSPRFRRVYFERAPVVFRVANNVEAITSITSSVLGLGDLIRSLDSPLTPLVYGQSQRDRNHRNVWFKQHTFFKDSGLKHATFPTKIFNTQLVEALAAGMTAFSHGVQMWERGVAALALEFSSALRLSANVNMDLTRAQQNVSLEAHNDLQCIFLVQLHHAKRWRVWLLPDVMLPVGGEHNVGKEESRFINASLLGTPYIDTTLHPGDVLYVPRGAVHWTSTEDAPEPNSPEDEGEAPCACCDATLESEDRAEELERLDRAEESCAAANGEAGEDDEAEGDGEANRTAAAPPSSSSSMMEGDADSLLFAEGESECGTPWIQIHHRAGWESEVEGRIHPLRYDEAEALWTGMNEKARRDAGMGLIFGDEWGPSFHLTLGVESLISDSPVHSASSTVTHLLQSRPIISAEWAEKDSYSEPWLASAFEYGGEPGSARAGPPPAANNVLFHGAFTDALARLASRNASFRRSLHIEENKKTAATQGTEEDEVGTEEDEETSPRPLPKWAETLKLMSHAVIDEMFASHTDPNSFVASIEATVTHKTRLSRELLDAFVKDTASKTLAAATGGYGAEDKEGRVRRAKKARRRARKKRKREEVKRAAAGAFSVSLWGPPSVPSLSVRRSHTHTHPHPPTHPPFSNTPLPQNNL